MTLDESKYWKIPKGNLDINKLLPKVGYDVKNYKIIKDNLDIALFSSSGNNVISFSLEYIETDGFQKYKQRIESALALMEFLEVNNQPYELTPSLEEISKKFKTEAQELGTLADKILKLEKKTKKK